jgi:hypothetical protein
LGLKQEGVANLLAVNPSTYQFWGNPAIPPAPRFREKVIEFLKYNPFQ